MTSIAPRYEANLPPAIAEPVERLPHFLILLPGLDRLPIWGIR
jgi:hypothetical protein